MKTNLAQLNQTIQNCELCPRLRTHCRKVAQEKRRSYKTETYWGKPVSGFGDPGARFLIVGLAPAAHGANRTGRIFTGDRSGDWLYRALHRQRFASQPSSTHIGDGLKLTDTYISCIARCAPPGNKPTPQEIKKCIPYLKTELEIFARKRVILALGGLAYDQVWQILSETQTLPKKPKFGHGVVVDVSPTLTILTSYHPSQQNTFTGKLTEAMFDSVFQSARKLLD